MTIYLAIPIAMDLAQPLGVLVQNRFHLKTLKCVPTAVCQMHDINSMSRENTSA